jgi:hypothetical protein
MLITILLTSKLADLLSKITECNIISYRIIGYRFIRGRNLSGVDGDAGAEDVRDILLYPAPSQRPAAFPLHL